MLRRIAATSVAALTVLAFSSPPANAAYMEGRAQVRVTDRSDRNLTTKCPDGTMYRTTRPGVRAQVCKNDAGFTSVYIPGRCEVTTNRRWGSRFIGSAYYRSGYWTTTKKLSRTWVTTVNIHCR